MMNSWKMLIVLIFLGFIKIAASLHWVTSMNNTFACETFNHNNKCKFEDIKYKQAGCGDFTSRFMLMLQAMAFARCDIVDPCRRKGADDIRDKERFDFIIVGAGVAGPVIARRLAEREPWWKVLLIEAGPEEPTMASFPGLAFNAINSSLDWNYKTEPTKPYPTACLETGGRCTWPRGKMVSGTGGMYGMMYVRGHPEIYNRWARMGNKGWSYNEIEHYFDRAEDPEEPGMTSGKAFKCTQSGGPLKIKYFTHKPPFADDLLDAAKELGYRTSRLYEYNQTGFMVAPMMTEEGQRGTTSKFYLRPIAHKLNLKVLTNARVKRILKNPWDINANGVELIDKCGKTKTILVDKEVILSAGAIGSPQILLASGIGPRKELHRLRIPLVKELNVGRNLHNHVSVGIKMTINDTHYQDITADSIAQYLQNRTGPLSSTGLTQVTAFMESSFSSANVPDIQVFFDGFTSTCPKVGLRFECYDGSLSNCPSRRELVARPTTLIIKSRGYLTLNSTNPFDPPLIYPNYFTDDQDLKILIEGIKKVAELTKTKAMKKWDLRLDENPIPECSRYHFGTDGYWECLIRVKTGPENHQSGTCKMGPRTDPEAVVDPELRLHGIQNIRVADASIFPIVPNANPAAAIIMVAEKASDMIVHTWRGI